MDLGGSGRRDACGDDPRGQSCIAALLVASKSAVEYEKCITQGLCQSDFPTTPSTRYCCSRQANAATRKVRVSEAVSDVPARQALPIPAAQTPPIFRCQLGSFQDPRVPSHPITRDQSLYYVARHDFPISSSRPLLPSPPRLTHAIPMCRAHERPSEPNILRALLISVTFPFQKVPLPTHASAPAHASERPTPGADAADRG